VAVDGGAGVSVPLGSKVRDRLTGFEGVATQRTEMLYGTIRICVEGYLDKDGRVPSPQWFDEPRIEVVEDGPKAGFRR
jgi:hypothetical protein